MSAKMEERFGQMWTPMDRGKGPFGQKLVLAYYSSMFCRRSLWVMPKYKLQLVIGLVRFMPQNIIWVGTNGST